MRARLLLALFLAGCPEPDQCSSAPESAEVSMDIIAGGVDDVVPPEGGPIPFVSGTQGASMAIFRVAYAGDGVDGCVRRTLSVTDSGGSSLLARSSAVELELEQGVWVEPQLQIIDADGDLTIEVEANGATLVREVTPRAPPVPTAFTGPTTGTTGAPIELVLGFEGDAPQSMSVELSVDPPSALVDPPSPVLPYGAHELPLSITASEPGTITVTARTYENFGVWEAQTVLTIE